MNENANPITAPLLHFVNQMREVNFSGINFFPSLVIALALGVITLALALLWPYGVIVVSSRSLWSLVVSTRDQMKDKKLLEKMPYTVTMGIFFLVWLPFALLCIPFALIGLVGRIIAGE